MKIKILTSVCAAVYAASIGASVVQTKDNQYTFEGATAVSKAPKGFANFVRPKLSTKIKTVEGLTGLHNYIIRLKDAPIASYKGDITGYKSTSPTYSKSFNQRTNKVIGNTSYQKRESLKIDFKSKGIDVLNICNVIEIPFSILLI